VACSCALDLAAALGGSAADGAIDNIVVNGTDGDDNIHVDGSRTGVDVSGVATAVSVTHADPIDSLSLNTFEGKNSVLVNGVAGLLQVQVDGTRAS
jgi:hypothetical protein